MLEGWLALISVKYHDNLLILMLLNQWLALIMLRATGPWLERSSSLLELYPSTVADGAILNSVSRQRKQINHYADQSTCANSMHFRKEVFALALKMADDSDVSRENISDSSGAVEF